MSHEGYNKYIHSFYIHSFSFHSSDSLIWVGPPDVSIVQSLNKSFFPSHIDFSEIDHSLLVFQLKTKLVFISKISNKFYFL